VIKRFARRAANLALPTSTITPVLGPALHDARLQLHHAAQLAAAAGISFLAPRTDDSHTTLEWIPSVRALASALVEAEKPFRVAVRPHDLSLLLLDGTGREQRAMSLHAQTLSAAAQWLARGVASRGAPKVRFTLDRHYEIPDHPVAHGAPFDATSVQYFDELSRWFGQGWLVLEGLRESTSAATAVRCWPHHFDITTLIPLERNGGAITKSIGVGLEPGDSSYDEPYWYVNAYPAPEIRGDSTLPALAGGGQWHRRDWIGAVLRAQVMPADAQAQECAVRDFIASGVAAFRGLLTA